MLLQNQFCLSIIISCSVTTCQEVLVIFLIFGEKQSKAGRYSSVSPLCSGDSFRYPNVRAGYAVLN